MALLDVTIVNVALPPMQADLDTSPGVLSWVVSGYALAFGAVLVMAGRLGDQFGRRRVFILAVVGFTVFSVLAGLAPSQDWLIAARVGQGISAGMINPQILGFIQQLFSGPQRSRAFGLFGAVMGIATAAGPLAGGILLEIAGSPAGWRLVFLINLPLGLVAFALAVRYLPSDRPEPLGVGDLAATGPPGATPAPPRTRLDVGGALLLAGAVLALLVPLVLAEREPGDAPWWLLAVAAGLLVALLGWERRALRTHGNPLLAPAVLRRPGFLPATALGGIYFAGFTALFFVLGFYLQQGLGYSPLQAGLAMTSYALASALAAAASGRLLVRRGHGVVTLGLTLELTGLLAAAAALVLPGIETLAPTGWILAGPLALAGIGNGLIIGPNQALALAAVPPAGSGTAGGILQTGQRLGSAIGVALVGAVFFAALATTPTAGLNPILGSPTVSAPGWDIAVLAALGAVAALTLLALVVSVLGFRRGPQPGDHLEDGHHGAHDDVASDPPRRQTQLRARPAIPTVAGAPTDPVQHEPDRRVNPRP